MRSKQFDFARLRDDEALGLIELLIAMLVVAVAVSALLALLTSSAVTLQRSEHRGTALTLANQQLELYRRLGWANISLLASTIPSGSCPSTGDPYATANCTDSTIPAATGTGHGVH